MSIWIQPQNVLHARSDDDEPFYFIITIIMYIYISLTVFFSLKVLLWRFLVFQLYCFKPTLNSLDLSCTTRLHVFIFSREDFLISVRKEDHTKKPTKSTPNKSHEKNNSAFGRFFYCFGRLHTSGNASH
jgi:hypothetical protein